MKHTECKDCKLRNGDCGHHFKMNGKTNYDIPSLTACDRYGDCMFFQQEERPKMEIKEVIEILSNILSDYKNDNLNFIYAKDMKALETAIEILKSYEKGGADMRGNEE